MNKRQRRDRTAQARRHARKIRFDDLHPSQQEGITVGATAREALAEIPDANPVHLDGEALLQHQMGGEQSLLDRLPVFRALLRDDTHSVWKEDDGRLQRNVIASVDVESFRSMQAGHMCLRCYEPQPDAFPNTCDMCGYPMRERQIMDIAMEFRGHEHVGPGLPIAEYLREQDERMEARERAEAKQNGRSPMTGLRRKIMSPGAAKLRGVKDGDVRAS